jgi:hypothetical protein
MTELPASWWIERHEGGARAVSAAGSVAAATPAELWRALANAAGETPLHLLEAGATPISAAAARAAAELASGGLDAVFGRVRYRDGTLSGPQRKLELMRFLAVPPGAIIARGAALHRAAVVIANSWDSFWAADLANALRHTGPAAGSGEILAASATPAPPTARLPFTRASVAGQGTADDGPLILVYGRLEASVSLYFDGLPAALGARLRFLEPGDLFSDMVWLAAASLVVVVRGFEHMYLTGTLRLLLELGVPYVWFTDDDLTALAAEQRGFAYYAPETLRSFTAGAAAILATSAPLRATLAPLHDNIIEWPLVHDAALRPDHLDTARPLVAGVFGGAFRHRAFAEQVLPPLRARGISTFANADLARGAAGVSPVPFEVSFRSFVFRWQRLGLRALLHPAGVSANMANKSRASLLAAAYLGAVPVVADEQAYAGLGEAQGVIVAAPDPQSWGAALDRLADPAEGERLYRRLDSWCRTAFDPEHARAPFARLAALALPDDDAHRAMRWQQAAESRVLQQALPRRSRFGIAIESLRRSLSRRLARTSR